MKDKDFTIMEYPAVRLFTADTGRINRDKHYVRAFLEVDVTEALAKLKQLRAPGRKVSFLAWFVQTLAGAVAEHPPINGIQQGGRRVVVFKTVDISVVVEKVVNGELVPLPLLITTANEKTSFEINNEIQAAIAQNVDDTSGPALGSGGQGWLVRLGMALPQWLRLAVMRRFILGNPQKMRRLMGTVMVTSLGTGGRVSGWIIPTSMHPLSIGLGTLTKKPAVHQGDIKIRDILNLTVAFDHNVVDGMPARKFVEALVAKMEAGAGLDALMSASTTQSV